MNDCGGQYENICKDEFAALGRKLDRIDAALRGNGGIGLQVRVDRLERSEAQRRKRLWLITAAALTGAAGLAAALVRQVIKGVS